MPAAESLLIPPDLLHPQPISRVGLDDTRRAIAFAFATGVSAGLFADALERRPLAPSTWDPAAFVNDLFVPDFVT
ncbi:MAG: DNA mismatch repair protein, partial [Polyangiaceae bacterium]